MNMQVAKVICQLTHWKQKQAEEGLMSAALVGKTTPLMETR